MPEQETYEPRLKGDYRSRIRPALKQKFSYSNEMQIPRLDKIVVNMGIGEAVADQGVPVDRQLQAARRHDHRRQGDAAQGPDVRVPRPADHHRAAAGEG